MLSSSGRYSHYQLCNLENNITVFKKKSSTKWNKKILMDKTGIVTQWAQYPRVTPNCHQHQLMTLLECSQWAQHTWKFLIICITNKLNYT